MTWATIVAILIAAPTVAQQAGSNMPAAQTAPANRVANQGQPAPQRLQQPFPPLGAAEAARLQQFLLDWQTHSQATRDLDCKFTRWHFDMFAAPAGVAATRADGIVRYAAPDKGLFRVDQLNFFIGMENETPQFKQQPGQFGEHWVCNGKQLIEFDRSKEECRIQDLPPQMQGQQIINSPLPFVFNLNAGQIQQRYWLRIVDVKQPGIVLVEAWPKRQEDRAQYKLVRIALDQETFIPKALLLYAPNFDAKTSPRWDHYEFTDVKRNTIGAGLQRFLNNFIPEKPPSNWKIIREQFIAPVEPPAQRAAAPQATQQR